MDLKKIKKNNYNILTKFALGGDVYFSSQWSFIGTCRKFIRSQFFLKFAKMKSMHINHI